MKHRRSQKYNGQSVSRNKRWTSWKYFQGRSLHLMQRPDSTHGQDVRVPRSVLLGAYTVGGRGVTKAT
eukprot:12887860-Prorocentrum_lima.AAC.1